jgi:hypothetical protein
LFQKKVGTIGSKTKDQPATMPTKDTNQWRIAFHDSSSIRGVVHSLEKVTPRAEFIITSEEELDDKKNAIKVYFMCVDATDLGQVCQLNTKLRLEYAENIPEELSFVLDCKDLLTAFDMMLPEFCIFFEGKVGGTQIVCRGYEADKRSHEVECTLDTYVIDEMKLVLPRFEPEYVLEIDLHLMKKNLRNVNKINANLVKFQVLVSEKSGTDQQSQTILSWQGKTKISHIMHCTTHTDPADGSIRIKTLNEPDMDRNTCLQNVTMSYEAVFRADKLEMFVKALSGGPNAKLLIELLPNMPMTIIYNIGDESNGSFIKLHLAPRNVDDDMMD